MMQKGYVSPKDFEKKFKVKQSESSQETQVSEGLSGQTQLLKSADQSVAYKNFNGNEIEETSLVTDAYQQTIQANQTDQYDAGVTTDHLEVAPQMNKQKILTQFHATTITNLTENIHTQDHRETLNLNQKVHIQNKQKSIPTQLQQTIDQSGSATTQALNRQIGAKNVSSQNYTESFGELKTQGNTTISGNGAMSAQKIYIGGAAPDSRIDFTLRKIADEYFPTVSAQVLGKSLPLGIFKTANFLITGQLDLEIDLDAQDKLSVNPAEFDQKDLSIDLCETINQYYAGFDIDSVYGLENLPNQSPAIDVNYANGLFNFKNGTQVGVQGGYFEFIYKTITNANIVGYQNWKLNMINQATVTIKFFPASFTMASNIMVKALQERQKVEQSLKHWSAEIMNNPIIKAEASYEQTQISNGSLPMEDTNVLNSADIGGSLTVVGSFVRIGGQPLILRVLNFTFEAVAWNPIK